MNYFGPKPFFNQYGPKQTKKLANNTKQGTTHTHTHTHIHLSVFLPTVLTLGIHSPPCPWQAHHEVRQRLGVVAFRLEGPLLGLDSGYFEVFGHQTHSFLGLGGLHEWIWPYNYIILYIYIFVYDWTYRWPDFYVCELRDFDQIKPFVQS